MKTLTFHKHFLTLAMFLAIANISSANAADAKLKGCEQVTCPAQNGEMALSLPNPDNLTSYCKCDWGTAYYFECPAGQEFNADEQACEVPKLPSK